MKKLTLLIFVSITISINAQMGIPQVVNDPEANAILKSLYSQQQVADTKALAEAQKTVLEINNQYKFITESVSKVENAVATLEVVADIKNNATAVVRDYSIVLSQLRQSKQLNPDYVKNQLVRLENIVLSNRKSFNFFSSVIKSDMMKMTTYERINLLEEINNKILALRSSIYNISRDASRRNQQSTNIQGIYSTPILK